MTTSPSRLIRRRVAGAAAGAAMLLAVGALPASALSLGLFTNTTLLHVSDCRTAALARQAAYDLGFSSNTTGPVPVHVAGVVDGSMTLCYSLDVKALSSIQTWIDSNVTVNGVVGGLLGTGDASKVCTIIHLKVAPGVTGTVTATAQARVSVDGAPPADWSDTFGKDVAVNSLGEDITLSQCVDTSGNVSAS